MFASPLARAAYIVCIEYFSDQPEEMPYRNETGLPYFGAYWLGNFSDLSTVGVSFAIRDGTP
jgi:hypothetical protein